MKRNKDQDFINSSLVARVPIELFFSLVANLILIFSIYVNLNLANQNQPQTLDEVFSFLLPVLLTTFVCVPFIILPIATAMSLATSKVDINVWMSVKLTARLQFSLIRQVGSSFGAQGSIAKLSNMRRLSSFVWVKHSGQVIICIRQDLRADVNSLVNKEAMNNIADDFAEVTNKTYTGYNIKTINDKFIFSHFKRYEVAELI